MDGCFAISRYTAALLGDLGVPPERVHVVPNGTRPEQFDNEQSRAAAATLRARYDLPVDGPMLATVGRLVPRKGVDTVIRALPRIADKVPNTLYVVAGGGPDRPRLEALAADQGVSERVRFLGKVPDADVSGLYQACTAFVMPARQEGASVEGFGLVFREAGACGKPVIGAYSGGVPDAIEHGDTGLLVPPADPRAFADAAIQLLSDEALAARLGARGREVVHTEGTWDRVAERMVAVMEAGL